MSRFRMMTVPLFAAALAIPACDDPTSVGEHAEAEGVAIVAGTQELYRYMLEDGTPVPTLTIELGTHPVTIIALDVEGQPLVHEHEEGDEAEELRITSTDATVLLWTPASETGSHEEVEAEGELDAVQAGTADLEICLLHGEHCDFEVTIPVEVEQTT